MRELKFRAWDSIDKEMMYPSKKSSFLINQGDVLNWFNEDCIMQYTGLKDKNGKDIYEGDIVKFHYFYFNGSCEAENEIVSDIKLTEYGISVKHEEEYIPIITFNGYHDESIEIIGDIYNNQELLK